MDEQTRFIAIVVGSCIGGALVLIALIIGVYCCFVKSRQIPSSEKPTNKPSKHHKFDKNPSNGFDHPISDNYTLSYSPQIEGQASIMAPPVQNSSILTQNSANKYPAQFSGLSSLERSPYKGDEIVGSGGPSVVKKDRPKSMDAGGFKSPHHYHPNAVVLPGFGMSNRRVSGDDGFLSDSNVGRINPAYQPDLEEPRRSASVYRSNSLFRVNATDGSRQTSSGFYAYRPKNSLPPTGFPISSCVPEPHSVVAETVPEEKSSHLRGRGISEPKNNPASPNRESRHLPRTPIDRRPSVSSEYFRQEGLDITKEAFDFLADYGDQFSEYPS